MENNADTLDSHEARQLAKQANYVQGFHHKVGPEAHHCRTIAHHQKWPVERPCGSPGQPCRYRPTADL